MAFTPISMEAIRQIVHQQLARFGYEVHSSSTSMDASMDGSNKMNWEIMNASPKKFEVTIRSDDPNDLVKEIVGVIANDNGKYTAFGRFRKDKSGAIEFVEWLAKCRRSHQHLLEALHPDTLPAPFGFIGNRFQSLNSGWWQGGEVTRARVQSIVGIKGVILIDAHEPGSKAWFLTELHLLNGRAFICTDGDGWYPVVKGEDKTNVEYRVLTRHGRIDVLSRMNERDRELIYNTVQDYIATITSHAEQQKS